MIQTHGKFHGQEALTKIHPFALLYGDCSWCGSDMLRREDANIGNYCRLAL